MTCPLPSNYYPLNPTLENWTAYREAHDWIVIDDGGIEVEMCKNCGAKLANGF